MVVFRLTLVGASRKTNRTFASSNIQQQNAMTHTKMTQALRLLAALLIVGFTSVPAFSQRFQHVRNATSRLTFAGKTFLIDPMLAPKGQYPGFPGTLREELRNPMVDLPFVAEQVLSDVDAIILTHTHLDHWDDVAQQLIDKQLPILVQNANDASLVRSQGFTNVSIIGSDVSPFAHIKLHRVTGKHGTDAMYAIPALAETLGQTIGVVFEAKGQKTVYIAGDTVWTDDVATALQRYKPAVIVLNIGNAQLKGLEGSILMNTTDLVRIAQQAPRAKIIAVHMEAINHCVLTRNEVKAFAQQHRLQKRVIAPADGQTLRF